MKKTTYLIGLITLILDQFVKYIVIRFLPFEQPQTIISNFFALTYTKNTGGAFSFLSGNVGLLSFIGILVLVGSIYYIKMNPPKNKYETLSLGIILGGLTGNLMDRVVRGGVIDFLDFYILKYDYPVFNIADIGIVLGIIGLIIIEIRGDKDESGTGKHTSRSVSK